MSKKRTPDYRRKIEKIAKTDPMAQFTPEVQEYIKNEIGKINNWGQNGFGVGNFNAFGFPQNQAFPGTEQLSRADTMFDNLRWYLVSNFRQVLSELYIELGLVQVICDVPVDDGLRGGVEIKSQQLEDDQIEELQISLDRDDDLNTAGQAAKWNRLFGGAGILILTDQDPEEPLNLEAIGPDSPLEFRAVDMWELFWDKQNTEGYDSAIQTQGFEFYNYYAEQVHKSRVMRLKGFVAPSFIRPRLRGWGFSVVEQLVRSLNQYLKATDLAFEVLDEFKIDVYKVKNLVNTLLSPQGQQKIQERVARANYMKNYQNALVMDSEDDWDHKQLSFTGLAETMGQIRMQVASDMRMPLTKLFGISAAGFNSGEDDIEVYNAMVESQVRNKLKYDILRICEIKCQKLFGFIPDDLSISFKPLRVLSAVEEENVKTQKGARVALFFEKNLITTYEARDAINRGSLLDVVLDNNGDVLNPNDPEILPIVKEGTMTDPYSVKEDTEDPGADREDSRKPTAWEYGGISQEPREPHPPTDKTAEKYKPAKPMPKSTKKARNSGIILLPKPFTQIEKIMRVVNGPHGWDKMSFQKAVEHGEVDPAKLEKLSNPGKVDEALWAKCKKRSMEEYSKINWPFVTYLYKKLGGTFQ